MILEQQAIEESEDYKFLSSGDAVFHYTKAETALAHILEKSTLKFSNIISSDDPYEYSLPSGTSTFGFNVAEEQQIQMMNYFCKIINKHSFRISFCNNSFSDGNLESNGFLKSRMWSQYGEGHQGVCLVFSKPELVEEVKNNICGSKDIFLYEDIRYGETTDLTLNSSDGYIDNNDLIQKVMNSITQQKQKFFHKVLDYRDENEFRLFLVKENIECDSMIDIDISKSLKYIIVGAKFPKVYYPLIKSFGEKFKIPYKKLHWESNKFYMLDIK